MAKFNTGSVRPAVSSPVKSEAVPSGRTHEGAPGYARDTKSELFLLAVTYMGGDTFYEPDDARSARFRSLVVEAGQQDPDWTARFLKWLRAEGNMRSAPLEAAVELVHAKPEGMRTRAVVDSVLQRADEPGEILACWLARYGRPIPIALKRGIADAVVRLYNEKSLLKHDSADRSIRFGDVIDMTQPAYHHPKIRGTWRYDLLGHALDRRHGRDKEIPESLALLRRRAHLMAIPVAERREIVSGGVPDAVAATLADAGVTWEALAGWLQGPMDKAAWEAIIPAMGLMALTRNLRNFDQAGVSDEVAATVAAKLADPEEVRRSKQFPFRFLSAYKAAPSLRWAYPLEQALGHSLANVPALKGRTLVLVDRSPSMWMQTMSKHSDMPWADAAAVFGAAVALRAESADLVEFGIENGPVPYNKAESLLKIMERFRRLNGTDIPSAVRAHLRAHHTRVVIVTDEQTRPGWLPSNGHAYGGSHEARIDDLIPANVPLYLWNFGGYTHGATPSGERNRHTFGGLSDAAFRLIPLLEAGANADWPF